MNKSTLFIPSTWLWRVLKKYVLNVIVGKRHVLKTYLHTTNYIHIFFCAQVKISLLLKGWKCGTLGAAVLIEETQVS